MAQEDKSLTLQDLIPGGTTYYRFIPENLSGLNWWGEKIAYYDIDEETLVLKSPTDSLTKEYLPLSIVNNALEGAGLKKIRALYDVSYISDQEILITGADYFAVFTSNTITNKIQVDQKRANHDYCPRNHTVTYTIENNLWIAESGGMKAITNEPQGIICGQAVHRNEFGINKGTFWSPRGKYLAFYRMDETMVTDYPLVDISTRVAELKNIKYPMAGMNSHKVTIGVYEVATGRTLYLDAGDPTDRYFTNIAWSPDETKIFIIELNRDQNHSQLVRYDAVTGKRETILIEETHSKYVEPEHPIVFLKGNGGQFIYQSQRDGFNHLYLYNKDGKLLRQLTSGEWLVKELLSFDEKGENLFIISTEKSPLEYHLYKVNIKSGKRTLLTPEEGLHQPVLSPSGKYAIDTYSSADVPRTIKVIDTNKAKHTQTLLVAGDPYKNYELPSIEVGTIKAADDKTDLYYRLVKPKDFDPNKKYPTIVYVYGGPHLQLIQNGFKWNVRGWDMFMAQKGYVVFSVDNRGSMNRGLEFENVIFRKLGVEEMKDQLKGIDFLKSLPFVDSERIGIHGWSYGGFMTVSCLLHHPEVYKVGVAGGPVIDWNYYEVMYGERYMDSPQSNPVGYQESNLKNYVSNLKGRLLIIHDDQDPTCVLQHSLSFMKACVDNFTFPELFIYPGHGHNVRGRDRVHLYEKITRYFDDNL